MKKFKDIKEKKQNYMHDIKSELMDLYCLVRNQRDFMDQSEAGAFSGGMYSHFIPARVKPLMPGTEHFPRLFAAINRDKIQKGLKHSSTTVSLAKEKSHFIQCFDEKLEQIKDERN